MDNKNENKIPLWLLFFNTAMVVSCLLLVFLIYSALHPEQLTVKTVAPKVAEAATFDNVNILAKAAVVFDLQNNTVIYNKNDTTQLPLASITKLLTALTALSLLPANTQITIRKDFLVDDENSGLAAGESWSLKNLLDFSLVVSSNGGARSIASVVGATLDQTQDFSLGRADFIKQMNLEAQKLGLSQSYFLNESGLDESSTQSGGYGSAIDVTKLMQYILANKPDILEPTKYASLSVTSLSTTHVAKNTDILADTIPGLLASKTGYTDLAGGNLVVAFDASIGHPFIAVVLGSTESGRFSDMQTLVNATMKYATTTGE
jgi:D-alanyl-D-alanine carboxypeptidase (penicillin-binding protein 5/6)